MNNPLLYHNCSHTQKHNSEEIMQEFKEKFQLSPNSNSCELLDIGCGDGYVTAKILTEYISKDINVMAIDKSESMINFASQNFHESNVKFKAMNIIDKPNECFQNRFDFITSFFCFHWVEDHQKLMENINLLMKPGGRCMFIFPLTHVIFDSYKVLLKNPVWSEVMEPASNFLANQKDSEDFAAEYTKMLQRTGFKNIKLEKRIKNSFYAGIEDLKNNVMAVDPFIDKLQSSEKEAYENDLMELILASPNVTEHFDTNQEKKRVNTWFTVIVGYFEKEEYFVCNKNTHYL